MPKCQIAAVAKLLNKATTVLEFLISRKV